MKREEEREITTAEISCAYFDAQAALGGQAPEIAGRAAVVISWKPLVPLGGREYGVENPALQILRENQIDSGEHRVTRRQENQSRAARLQNAGDGPDRRLGIFDVFEQRLANHQIGVRLPVVLRDIGRNAFVVRPRRRRGKLPLVDVEPDHAQVEQLSRSRADYWILSAADIVDHVAT